MANSTESAKDNATEKGTASVPSEKPKSHDGTLAEQSASSENSADVIPPEFINGIPEPARTMVKETMIAQMGVMRQDNPIAKKNNRRAYYSISSGFTSSAQGRL
jgi:hypothetical protein